MLVEDDSRLERDPSDSSIKDRLFHGFREDHALMGKAFYRLANGLRGGLLAEARQTARQIDEEVGAHIAFEEHDVYPLLVPILGKDCVSEMYDDHREGREVIHRLAEAESVSEDECGELLARTEKFQQHIEECADLFGAIAQIPSQHSHLNAQRIEWQRKRPRWTELP